MKAFQVNLVAAGLILAAFGGLTAAADVWPQVVGAMEHVLISLDDQTNAISAHVEHGDITLNMNNFGELHTPPADVLDGKGYNDQYGWLQEGIINLPLDRTIWIEQSSATAGLEVYEGGMRMMRDMHTYAPIFGTAGSAAVWEWPFTMTHHWYAAADFGDYAATYSVYVGDLSGAADPAYTPGEVTLRFSYVPEPGALVMAALGGLIIGRRR